MKQDEKPGISKPGGSSEPGLPGSKQGQIDTPMCTTNAGKGAAYRQEKYEGTGMPSDKGGEKIYGPGVKNKW